MRNSTSAKDAQQLARLAFDTLPGLSEFTNTVMVRDEDHGAGHENDRIFQVLECQPGKADFKPVRYDTKKDGEEFLGNPKNRALVVIPNPDGSGMMHVVAYNKS